MVKIMNTNKIIIFCTVVAIILIIAIPTTLTVHDRYKEKVYKITEKRIIEAAKNCHLKDECLNEIVTLKELYDLGLLEKESDPITKKYYNESSYVDMKDYKFHEVG